MNRRLFFTNLLLPAVCAVALAGAAVATPGDDKAKAQIGKPAPDFTLADTAGKEHKLSDYKGKIVVLEWINPDCPVCRRVMSSGVVDKMRKRLAALDKDLVLLAINSTHYMDAKATAAYLEKNKKKDLTGLVDTDGKVGHLYGARTTPHMFVIDTEGVLRYNGAIDDDRSGSKGDEAMNYVVNAVRQITSGETVAPDNTRPYGCSVKYRK